MKILIINGPNINMLGIREVNIYGKETYAYLLEQINLWAKEVNADITTYQSNHEGALVDRIQEAYFEKYDGIIINPGAYTHTSIAILDALKAVMIPCIEVHLSDVNTREEFRRISYIRSYCFKSIMGLGLESYHKAIIEMVSYLKNKRI